MKVAPCITVPTAWNGLSLENKQIEKQSTFKLKLKDEYFEKYRREPNAPSGIVIRALVRPWNRELCEGLFVAGLIVCADGCTCRVGGRLGGT